MALGILLGCAEVIGVGVDFAKKDWNMREPFFVALLAACLCALPLECLVQLASPPVPI